ncbi:Aste57867_2256 [Aphanomyces stellatus]|uniref:Aste57867_2256 protein n=1 Tax=Aphanomyces stellatus TaxID=120398 RepID=A0A485K9R4_9STRA|nr:hypothetical protein As57867_002251 [Aphanomyces stellatus]VFT79459.1 Aste57867_2256 [Aphanomyces stellatus]
MKSETTLIQHRIGDWVSSRSFDLAKDYMVVVAASFHTTSHNATVARGAQVHVRKVAHCHEDHSNIARGAHFVVVLSLWVRFFEAFEISTSKIDHLSRPTLDQLQLAILSMAISTLPTEHPLADDRADAAAAVVLALYWVGGLFFLVGSFLFYPHDDAAPDRSSAEAVTWLFSGCLVFFLGACFESHSARRALANASTGLVRFFPLLAGLANAIGSLVCAGASVCFWPSIYAAVPTAGCLGFMVGCMCFAAAHALDLTRTLSSAPPVCPVYVLAVLLGFVADAAFIVGSYSFLPQFIVLPEDTTAAAANTIAAVNLFVAGSTCFCIAPFVYLVSLRRARHENHPKAFQCVQ